MKKLLIISALFSCVIGCAEQEVDRDAEAQKIIELSREWAKSAKANDTEKILSYWTDDAMVMSPGQPATIGKDNLRKMVELTSSIPGFEIYWAPKQAYVSKSGDLAYATGINYVKMQDTLGNQVTVYNRGIEIWKKQEDGSWKCVVDIYTPDPTLKSLD